MGTIKGIFFSIIFFVTVCLGVISYMAHNYSVDFSALESYRAGDPSILLDDEGNEWGRFELDRQDPVCLSAVPLHVQRAFLASEDRQFFDHAGISCKSIIRSIFVNLYHLRKVQGASTITQQLVRLLFFDAKKTFRRKIKEQFVALMVERQYTKEQILQTYLNNICFGCGIYGVNAAAKRFWGKSVQELTLAQGATLAGIVPYPARYCPLVNPDIALKRRNVVLRCMVNAGFIDERTCKAAQAEPLGLLAVERSADLFAPHLKEAIRQHVEERYGKLALYNGGLIIKTTINRGAQERAERIFCRYVEQMRGTLGKSVDGALVSLVPWSGAVKALIGGYSFRLSQFNRATQAHRQLGSLFKPLVYTGAILAGRTFADTEVDEPTEFVDGAKTWAPKNSTNAFEGRMTLVRALAFSNNIVAVKTLMRVGVPYVAQLARACKIDVPDSMYLSMALGCVEASPLQAAGMFNVFANDGVYCAPHFISWIKDNTGQTIYQYMPECERVFDTRIVGQTKKALTQGFKRYMDRVHETSFLPEAICKTGTTNDSKTCWFGGATPKLTTVVYIGRDDNTPLGHDVYPISTAFPIWLDYNRLVNNSVQRFKYDPTLKEVVINWFTGRPADPNDPDAVAIYV